MAKHVDNTRRRPNVSTAKKQIIIKERDLFTESVMGLNKVLKKIFGVELGLEVGSKIFYTKLKGQPKEEKIKLIESYIKFFKGLDAETAKLVGVDKLLDFGTVSVTQEIDGNIDDENLGAKAKDYAGILSKKDLATLKQIEQGTIMQEENIEAQKEAESHRR